MDWMVWGLLAGLVLGTYDFLTKLALAEKSVVEVVFWCCAIGALLWLPLLCLPARMAPRCAIWDWRPACWTAASRCCCCPSR